MEHDTPASPQIVFEPFRLDPADERLWRGEENVPLGRKALEVLLCLVGRPGRLVTKREILEAVWPETAVSEAVLTTAVRELRRALGDRAREPRYVETVHGRGYRFIAPVLETERAPTVADPPAARAPESPAGGRGASTQPRPPRSYPVLGQAPRLVGREAELARLEEWYAAAAEGDRRIGFVAGEAGIGKTSLVETFLGAVAATGTVWSGRGQCIEQYGAGEAYLPILEALVRLGHDPAVPVADVFFRHAPSWLPHVPAILPQDRRPRPGSVTPARMLRELAEAVEVLTAHRPLVFVLEDLHWSDAATLEWLGYVARRRDRARLLVLGTYRPVEALLHRHPLRRLVAELRQTPQCDELVLDYLDREAVESYVEQRYGDDVPNRKELAGVLHRRTGGHPLFLATIIEGLRNQTLVAQASEDTPPSADLAAVGRVIPTSVRQFIEHRFELLSPQDRAILEAGSVAGDPFSVAAVVAGTDLYDETVEARCATWAGEGRFLVAEGTVTWPDGRLAACYRFRHALFQEVLYGCISPERRARLHRLVGDRLERAWGERAGEIAAELAVHFEQGRELDRAVSYAERAARRALERSAYSEARRHLERGLKVLARLPDDRRRLEREIDLSLVLGQVLMSMEGWGAREVEQLYRRLRALCTELEDDSRLPSVIWGEMAVSVVRSELRTTQELSEELLELARRRGSRLFEIVAQMELGGTALLLGELTTARDHLRRADELYEPDQHAHHVSQFGVDFGVFSRAWETHLLWQIGDVDRALERSERLLALSQELAHPLTRTVALAYAAMLQQFRLDVGRVEELASETIRQSREHGFPYYLAWGDVLGGWSRAVRGRTAEGLADIRRGLDTLQSTGGARLPYYRSLLADALRLSGRNVEALATLDEALGDVEQTGERWWLAELYRLKGELLRLLDRGAEAEACLSHAVRVAREQGGTALELRAAESASSGRRTSGRGGPQPAR